jgi:hypothetical protein
VERVVLNALPNQCGFAANFLCFGMLAHINFAFRRIGQVYGEADPPLR